MKTVAITGVRGFIGAAVSRAFVGAGHRVIGLTRREADGADNRRWQLGEPLPFDGARIDAVIHLASAALVENSDLEKACQRDIDGTRMVRDQLRDLRGRDERDIPFIFISSQSARADALNAYGRSKWLIEQILDRPGEIVVRPGLVFDDAGSSVFQSMRKIARLPVVPVIDNEKVIQPIHVDDLARALLRVVDAGSSRRLYQLGPVAALSFSEFITEIAAGEARRAPIFIPLSARLVGAAAKVVDALLRPTPSLEERVQGLTGLRRMDTADSLEALDLVLRPFGRDVPLPR